MKIDLCEIDWTAISAIASFVMILVTWLTLRQNKKQVNELNRQWKEQNRPKLSYSVIPSQKWYCFKISI